ncbi:response regulator [Spirulina sp. CCNP1310]|nr:response regulator [Spirulina sp. CCNP1310]MEA5417852.1 response regulator [Spirulina sp. CCNP1310]
MDAEQRKKITGYFILEAKEHLEVMDESLQHFQATIDDPEQIHEIYRGAHSIKGGAAMLDFEAIRFTAHRLEDYFKFLKNNPFPIDRTLEELIHEVYQILTEGIDTLEATLNLPSKFAQDMLARVQPLCERVSQHLEQLTAGRGESVELPDEMVTALNAITVLAQQPDDAGNRVQIQRHCQNLLEQWQNHGDWHALVEAAQGAIAYPQNDYSHTSHLILTALRTGAMALVKGEAIALPPELQAMAEAPPASVGDIEDVFSEDPFATDSASAQSDWLNEDPELAEFLNGDLQAPPPPPAPVDDLEALLNEFDTTPPIEGRELDQLLSAFDTHPAIPEPSPPSDPPDLSQDLDDLFGAQSGWEEEDWETGTESASPLPPSGEDLLAIGQSLGGERSATTYPSPAPSSSEGELFGADFSFETEADTSENATIFDANPPSYTGATVSGTVHHELDRDLNDLFADFDDPDTHGVLNPDFNATSPGVVVPDLPVVQDDFGDLLAIGDNALGDIDAKSTAAMFGDDPENPDIVEFDPLGTFTGQEQPSAGFFGNAADPELIDDDDDIDVDDLAAFLSGENADFTAPLPSPPPARFDDLNGILGEEADTLSLAEIDDLGAFLSGETEEGSTLEFAPRLEAKASFDDLFADVVIPEPTVESNNDFNDLFGLTPETHGDSHQIDDLEALLSGKPDETIDDLEALLSGKPDETIDDPSFGALEAMMVGEVEAVPLPENNPEVDELEALFAAAAAAPVPVFREPSPPISVGAKNVSPPPVAAETPTELGYYTPWDELLGLVERSPLEAKDLTVATSFAALEALLEENNTIAPPIAPTLEHHPVPLDVAPAPNGEWDDLINIVQEAQQKAGELIPAQRPIAKPRSTRATVEATLKVPVKQMDNLNNLVGELVVNRNSLEGDEERLRQFLDNLMHQVQNLNDVGGRMQDLYERSLLEDALLRSRREYRAKQGGNSDFGSSSSNGTQTQTTSETVGEFDELEMDSFTKFHELAQETIEMIVRVRESTADIQFLVDDIDQVARTLRQVTSQLQEGLNKSRMVPFGNTASRLPLAVKRIAPQLNKQANLELEGQETLVDKMLLEHLSDPLTHLVNNALTHGIEPPEIRLASGKSQAGHIKVSALQQGNQTVISVSDDGAGIDSHRVKQKAVEKGLLTPGQAAQMDEQATFELLFHPGFSTKDQADNFAGRGVGLDVVRTSIHDIRGTVMIDSKLNKGTTFTIRLPLTLSIGKALCCISENAPIAFPLDGVEDMVDVPHHKLRRNAQGQPCVQYRDMLLPYHHLSALLTYNRRIGRGNFYGNKREDNILSVVVLRGADNHIAVGVDQVLGEQEIVIKQLQGPVPKPAGIAGATVRGDGTIMAIADVLELIELAQGRLRKETSSWQTMNNLPEEQEAIVRSEPTVLIVDDSITVRELLSMTFGKAGYRVEQARDGQDAWDKLCSGLPCDIVFCDIEMPRVDGLELLDRLSHDEELRDLPIAMLTSRGAERHRNVAAELGACGYFTKPYLEDILLDAAERMMQGEILLENSSRKQRSPKPKAAPLPTPEPAPLPILANGYASGDDHIPVQVLIIDDSVTVRSLLSMTFEKAGYQVEQARDGKEAWDKLNSGLRPDLIFCDIEMPRLDGLELLGQIYGDGELNRIPVAMLTSRGAERHRKVAAERGASGYFTKPYVEQELLAAADRIRRGEVLLKDSVRSPGLTTKPIESLPEVAVPEPPMAPLEVDPQATMIDFDPQATMIDFDPQATVIDFDPQPTVFQESSMADFLPPVSYSQPLDRQPRVLIIDDSITVRSLLSMTFEKAGYEVEQARDGKEALDKLQGGLNPDLAFCDIEMPKMDGLTLLDHVAADSRLHHIPIAMLTSRGAKKHQLAAAERGAKGYFTKPYTEDVLLDAAERLMRGEVLLKVEA